MRLPENMAGIAHPIFIWCALAFFLFGIINPQRKYDLVISLCGLLAFAASQAVIVWEWWRERKNKESES